MKNMKQYIQPETIEIVFNTQGVIALSNGNEEGEGEYSRKQGWGSESRSGFGTALWSDMEN